MHHLYATGRMIYGAVLGLFALIHFFNGPAMTVIVPGWVPGPGIFWVYAVGAVLAFGSFALLTNRYVYQASLMIAALLLIFVLTVHIPSVRQNPMNMSNLLKDLAMMGAALTFAAHGSKSTATKETV